MIQAGKVIRNIVFVPEPRLAANEEMRLATEVVRRQPFLDSQVRVCGVVCCSLLLEPCPVFRPWSGAGDDAAKANVS